MGQLDGVQIVTKASYYGNIPPVISTDYNFQTFL